MKIYILEQLGIALFEAEAEYLFINDKLLFSVVNENDKTITAWLLIGGRRVTAGGLRDAIPISIVSEGAHPLSVECNGKIYTVGSVTRTGNKLKTKAVSNHRALVSTAIRAEHAFKVAEDLVKRVEKLETATFGVNILNLNSEV